MGTEGDWEEKKQRRQGMYEREGNSTVNNLKKCVCYAWKKGDNLERRFRYYI